VTACLLTECKAFIFDMDGTLTVPQHDFDAIRTMLGIPKDSLILEYLDALPEDAQQEKRAQLDKLEAELAAESKPAPGLFELLNELSNREIGIGLLTRNSLSNAHISLNAIGAMRYFREHTLAGRDEAEPKPHPAGIELLAKRLGTAAHQCAMVGDYRHDLEAGARAGAHSVHVQHPGTPQWPQFTQTTVNNLNELLDLITVNR